MKNHIEVHKMKHTAEIVGIFGSFRLEELEKLQNDVNQFEGLEKSHVYLLEVSFTPKNSVDRFMKLRGTYSFKVVRDSKVSEYEDVNFQLMPLDKVKSDCEAETQPVNKIVWVGSAKPEYMGIAPLVVLSNNDFDQVNSGQLEHKKKCIKRYSWTMTNISA